VGVTTPAVLAIDGGNSKTDVALVAADGELLSEATGPGLPTFYAMKTWLADLTQLVDRVREHAGLPGPAVAEHISACVANADLPEEEKQLAAALQAKGWSRTTTAANDTFAVLRAGVAGQSWGVAVTCGAGINCVGTGPDGESTGFLALGGITGDWGGGQGLGQAALWHAIRAEDGRGPATALTGAVAGHYGVPTVRDVALGIHLAKIDKYTLLDLAPVLFAVADAGDGIAAGLIRHQADEIAVMALTVMRRLGLTGQPTPVVLGGGVMRARNESLIRQITDLIAAGAPHATVHIVDVPPVVGAALLGLDHTGAPPDAERRLRAACNGKAQQ
jgi:N-acetylglucosamine kinase-like BadF-type ATPase